MYNTTDINNGYNTLKNRRSELMGFAILMVMFFHLYCWPEWNNPLRLFRYWFIGVDLFLFLSGFGLCFSYCKNDIKTFYFHRFIRIFPLYWIYLLGAFGYYIYIANLHYGIKDFLLNATTLSFWIHSSRIPDWYICTIIFLYFCFPVLYKITKRWPVTIYLTSNFITLAVLKYAKLEWYQDCFISRIPIFLFGILYFHINKCQNSLYKALLISLFFWNIAIEYSNSKFFITSSFCPILIFVLSYILGKRMVVTKKINNYISYMGTHSYELFLSNGFTQFTLIEINNIYNITLPIIILIYISSTIFYGFAFIKIQKLINKCINIW